MQNTIILSENNHLISNNRKLYVKLNVNVNRCDDNLFIENCQFFVDLDKRIIEIIKENKNKWFNNKNIKIKYHSIIEKYKNGNGNESDVIKLNCKKMISFTTDEKIVFLRNYKDKYVKILLYISKIHVDYFNNIITVKMKPIQLKFMRNKISQNTNINKLLDSYSESEIIYDDNNEIKTLIENNNN